MSARKGHKDRAEAITALAIVAAIFAALAPAMMH